MKVSDAEETALVLRANEQAVTVARLLVESALSSAPGDTVTDRRNAITFLFRLERALAKIAVNINQITKLANGTGVIRVEELVECVEGMKLTMTAIRDAVRRIRL